MSDETVIGNVSLRVDRRRPGVIVLCMKAGRDVAEADLTLTMARQLGAGLTAMCDVFERDEARREAEQQRDWRHADFCAKHGHDPLVSSKMLLPWELVSGSPSTTGDASGEDAP